MNRLPLQHWRRLLGSGLVWAGYPLVHPKTLEPPKILVSKSLYDIVLAGNVLLHSN